MKTAIKSSPLFKSWKDMTKPQILDWVLVAVISLFCYISFNHADLLTTSTHGKDLIEVALKGDFLSFYEYTEGTAVYLIPIFIIFAIWSIVPFLAYKIAGVAMWGPVEFEAVPFGWVMWYKLLPTLFLIGCAWILYRIIRKLGFDDNAGKWGIFLFFSSPLTVFCQFIFGQYDSIGLFFILLAVYCFLKKKYYVFSLLGALAITFKFLPIFVFVPMILLVEKRVIHLIKHGAIMVSAWILCTLIFAGSSTGSGGDFTTGNMPKLIFSGISVSFASVSLFLLGMMMLCVYCYMLKPKDENEFNRIACFVPFAAFGLLFGFVEWNPQWLVLFAPFLALTALQNRDMKLSIILDIVICVGYLGLVACSFRNNVDVNMLNRGIFSEVLSRDVLGVNIADIFEFGGILNKTIYQTLITGGISILLFLRFPIDRRKNDTFEVGLKMERGFVLLRLLTVFIFIIPAFYLFFKA